MSQWQCLRPQAIRAGLYFCKYPVIHWGLCVYLDDIRYFLFLYVPAMTRCCSAVRTVSMRLMSIIMRRCDSRNWSLAICHVFFSSLCSFFSASSRRQTKKYNTNIGIFTGTWYNTKYQYWMAKSTISKKFSIVSYPLRFKICVTLYVTWWNNHMRPYLFTKE